MNLSLRKLKQQVRDLLRQEDLSAALEAMEKFSPRQVINPLFGLLYDGEPLVRWHAVTAMGAVTARLADENMESARVIMRRLMWNLNDESGGIGWGAPEAMGEIMACHERLALEYVAILISYLNPDGNFLEHEGLQRGLLWGIGRLAHARPHFARDAAPFLPVFFSSLQSDLRGLAAWAAGAIISAPLRGQLKPLCTDPAVITLYQDRRLVSCTVGSLATAAIN